MAISVGADTVIGEIRLLREADAMLVDTAAAASVRPDLHGT
jgi:hypothetical protein